MGHVRHLMRGGRLLPRRWALAAIWPTALCAVAAPVNAEEASLPALRSELVTRARVDQELRAHIDLSVPQTRAAWANIQIVDRANTARMRQLVRRYGWLTRAMVGDDGAAAAWLLVQHADSEPAFQYRVLELLDALPNGEIPGESRALLTDRVLLARGSRQRFGSQVEGDCSEGFKVRPLEDPGHVDERRAEFGMGSLAAYLDQVRTFFCPLHTDR